MEIGAIAAWAAVVVSAVVAYRAWRSERAAKASAAESAENARRATDASERSAAAAVRSADALERQVALAEEAAAKYVPPWRLEHERGDLYALVNEGSDMEYSVSLTGARLPKKSAEPRDVAPRSRITFMAIPAWGKDSTVVVTWHRRPDGSDEALSWSHPLPSKP